jgi:hypothetical protein
MTRASGQTDVDRKALAAFAIETAERVWRALHPPEEATDRAKAILLIAGSTDASEDTAAYLLDRCPGATDAALADDQRRHAICRMLIGALAPPTYREQ